MSAAAYERSKEIRRLCQTCEERKARVSYHGIVKADRDHTLCFQCFRAERERQRAQLLAGVVTPTPLRAQFQTIPPLTARKIEHRRRMLAHLTSARAATR